MKENTQVEIDVDRDPSSDTETNHTEWSNVIWLSSMLVITGIAVCLVFNYIF